MFTPILATLGYIVSGDRKKILMVHRNARPNDDHFGKYNGLGGKLQAHEDIYSCLRREIHEESGLDNIVGEMCGTISWPGFGSKGEDWFGFVFIITEFEGSPFESNVEGQLQWVPIQEILNLPLWEGDRHFLPLVFEKIAGKHSGKTFHGVMPYEDGSPVSWNFSWSS